MRDIKKKYEKISKGKKEPTKESVLRFYVCQATISDLVVALCHCVFILRLKEFECLERVIVPNGSEGSEGTMKL